MSRIALPVMPYSLARLVASLSPIVCLRSLAMKIRTAPSGETTHLLIRLCAVPDFEPLDDGAPSISFLCFVVAAEMFYPFKKEFVPTFFWEHHPGSVVVKHGSSNTVVPGSVIVVRNTDPVTRSYLFA